MKQKQKGKITKVIDNHTAKVEIEKFKKFAKYHKKIKMQKYYLVDTPKKLEVGEKVVIESTKPISKQKFWKVVK